MRAKVNCARCGRSMGEVALLGSEDPASPRPRYCGDSRCRHPALRREPQPEMTYDRWIKTRGQGKGLSGAKRPQSITVAPAPAPKVKRPDELDEQQRAEVRRRLADGASNTTIARELGIDVGLVWVEQSRTAQERRGEQRMAKADKFSEAEREDIARRVADGEKPSHIAEEWEGATPQLIGRIAKAELGREGMLAARKARAELAKIRTELAQPAPRCWRIRSREDGEAEPEPADHPQPRDLEDEDEAPEEVEAPAPDRPSTIYGLAREAAERAPEAAPAEEVEELRRKVEELERELSIKAKAIPALDRDCAAAMKRAREGDARVAELEQLLEDERRKSDSRLTLAAPKTCPDCLGRLDADGDCPPCLSATMELLPAPQPPSGLRAIGAAAWEALCAAREEDERRALSGVMEACIAGLGIKEQRG